MLTVKHPWHGLSPGDGAPRIVNAIIEIPQGSRAKYEIDKDSGLIKLDRVIFASMYYPLNYGFIPQTFCGEQVAQLCAERTGSRAASSAARGLDRTWRLWMARDQLNCANGSLCHQNTVVEGTSLLHSRRNLECAALFRIG